MAEVGQAAASGTAPPTDMFVRLRQLAALEPLRPDPFLVEGALAERRGDYERAKVLFMEARRRDPRSLAARYLLADVAFRQNSLTDGLEEIAALTKLVPAATVKVMPSLAAYAKSPGARQILSTVLVHNPQLKAPLLLVLASDPNNWELILSLAGPPASSTDADTKTWQSRLLNGMIARGDFGRAFQLWLHFANLNEGDRPLLFNGDFKSSSAPAPFNWDLSGSGAGLAEMDGGRLRILFYGRDDVPLAAQVLMLPAGNYTFYAPSEGQVAAGALSWTIRCLPMKSALGDLPVDSSRPALKFNVPAGCAAQLLQLNGHALDMPRDSDIRIGPLRIEKAGE